MLFFDPDVIAHSMVTGALNAQLPTVAAAEHKVIDQDVLSAHDSRESRLFGLGSPAVQCPQMPFRGIKIT